MTISNIKFIDASPEDQATGLLGYLDFVYNNRFRFNGLTVRRTADQRLTISYPFRRHSSGRKYFYLWPLDNETRQQIEREVFIALDLEVPGQP